MTRREQALGKIVRLERRLEWTHSNSAVEKMTREICRLQLVYKIDMEEIKSYRTTH